MGHVPPRKLTNGLSFTQLARLDESCDVILAYKDKRVILRGTVTVDLQKGSSKYGPQMQIHVFTEEEPVFEERYENKKYTRLEIAMPVQKGFNFLMNAASTFRKVRT